MTNFYGETSEAVATGFLPEFFLLHALFQLALVCCVCAVLVGKKNKIVFKKLISRCKKTQVPSNTYFTLLFTCGHKCSGMMAYAKTFPGCGHSFLNNYQFIFCEATDTP